MKRARSAEKRKISTFKIAQLAVIRKSLSLLYLPEKIGVVQLIINNSGSSINKIGQLKGRSHGQGTLTLTANVNTISSAIYIYVDAGIRINYGIGMTKN